MKGKRGGTPGGVGRKGTQSSAAGVSGKKRKFRYVPTPPAKPSLRAAPILARLPQRSAAETMQIWSNAVRILAQSTEAAEREEAQAVLDGVETVWLLRARGAPEGWFKWPSTEAPVGAGGLDSKAWLELGPLKLLGYSVGREGAAVEVRREVLARVFAGVLPPIFPPAYIVGWGEPRSPARLHKMADSIASFARSAKRRDAELLGEAIEDWEADLTFLHATYYVGHFHFAWPRSAVGI